MTSAFSFRQSSRTKHLGLAKEGTEKIMARTDNKKDSVKHRRLGLPLRKPFGGGRHGYYVGENPGSVPCVSLFYSWHKPILRF